MRTPTTAQVRTVIEVLKKAGERIDNQRDLQTSISRRKRGAATTQPRHRGQTIEQIARVKTVVAQLESWRDELQARQEALCFSACLRQGTRYPFVPKVSAPANRSR